MTMLRLMQADEIRITPDKIVIRNGDSETEIANRIDEIWISNKEIAVLVRGTLMDYQISMELADVGSGRSSASS